MSPLARRLLGDYEVIGDRRAAPTTREVFMTRTEAIYWERVLDLAEFGPDGVPSYYWEEGSRPAWAVAASDRFLGGLN